MSHAHHYTPLSEICKEACQAKRLAQMPGRGTMDAAPDPAFVRFAPPASRPSAREGRTATKSLMFSKADHDEKM
jgi:hypothetical protein